MQWVDLARYAMGVLFVMTLPGAVAWWLVIHPFASFWRARGTTFTFWVIGVLYAASIALLYLPRQFLLGVDLGLSFPLVIVAIPLFVLSSFVQWQRKKHLTMRILTGVPEVAGMDDPDNRLLMEGIYGKIRHPRYVEFVLGAVAWSLVINYVGVYVMTILAIGGILFIVPLEERELQDRFGVTYEEYSRQVPRFVPRLGLRM